MTPEILSLSRTICGMEGAPRCPGGFGVRRDGLGMLWLSDKDDEESIGWVLDLTDPATGGALLPYCGWIQAMWTNDTEVNVAWGPDIGQSESGATLGIALAKVIAVRGWGRV